jgi:hypothetical protein
MAGWPQSCSIFGDKNKDQQAEQLTCGGVNPISLYTRIQYCLNLCANATWERDMLNNAFLDIAIGLVTMYLVLSLMGTVVNEFISTTISLRASTLKKAVENLLGDRDLIKRFKAHGLVAGTTKTAGDPSYLTGQTFAMALLGVLVSGNPSPGLDQINKAIKDLGEASTFGSTLQSLVVKAGDDATKLRDELANYFDASMDRVSGIYKRRLKWISLGVGFLIVVALNADSIKAGNALWKDSSLRAQMAATSQTVLAGGKPDAAPKTITTSELTSQLTSLEKDVRPLPIGLTGGQAAQLWSMITGKWSFTSAGVWWFLTKLFGLAITAFAISLGAPFWFDTLSKFMNIRGTGAKPQTSAEANPKTTPNVTVSMPPSVPAPATPAPE